MYKVESVREGLEKYRARIKEASYLDFSAMLEIAVAELMSDSALQARISQRVKYVVVDEYQDVNPVQERLVRLLHDLGADLCVVGDDDQTIYQWRGSSVETILEFQNRYPDVSTDSAGGELQVQPRRGRNRPQLRGEG